MEQPLVSVLIPAYNHEKYIQETIKSIISQTYKNIELIVIDDGSTDSTWQKMQEMKSACETRFNRVHFETKQNEGVCKTLNKLISLAKGEYIFMTASDDFAMSNTIEKEVNFLSQNQDYSLCVGNSKIIDSESKVCYWDKKRNIVYNLKKAKYKTFVDFLKKHNNYFNDRDFGSYQTLYRENYIPNGFTIRKSTLDRILPYPEGLLEDWWLVLQISKYSKMKYINEILYCYRWHNNNSIKQSDKMNLIEKNTLRWENKFWEKADLKNFPIETIKVVKNGVVKKKRGVPFLLEIITLRKNINLIKLIKIFNFPVYRQVKSL